MAVSRYQRRRTAKNSDELYAASLKKRGLKFIEQYKTARLSFPTERQLASMNFDKHLWNIGDRFYKLAHEYYGDTGYWWVIAWFNKKPAEHLISAGDIIFIPLNLEEILDFLEV